MQSRRQKGTHRFGVVEVCCQLVALIPFLSPHDEVLPMKPTFSVLFNASTAALSSADSIPSIYWTRSRAP